jgi:4-hydroxy-tetrahydrodipicolinate reductase
MSVGIALLRRLARQAAQVLGPGFDVEITETHHRRKKDAPSGTALMLFHAIEEARGEAESRAVCGRSGRDAQRTPGEIGIHALRGGTVVGEHEVAFLGDQERIRLSHSAESRSVFALGALRAAAYLIGKEPGLYDMDDMLSELL